MRVEARVRRLCPAFAGPEERDVRALAFPDEDHRALFALVVEAAVVPGEVVADGLIEAQVRPSALARERELARDGRPTMARARRCSMSTAGISSEPTNEVHIGHGRSRSGPYIQK